MKTFPICHIVSPNIYVYNKIHLPVKGNHHTLVSIQTSFSVYLYDLFNQGSLQRFIGTLRSVWLCRILNLSYSDIYLTSSLDSLRVTFLYPCCLEYIL